MSTALPTDATTPSATVLTTAPILPADTPTCELPFVLVMDNFSAHVDERVTARAREIGVEIVLLPPHMTSLLQPLDVGVNKSLKAGIRKRFMSHLIETMADHQHLISPKRQDVARWTCEAWRDVSDEAIKGAWRRALDTYLDPAVNDSTGAEGMPPLQTPDDVSPDLETEELANTLLGFVDDEVVFRATFEEMPPPPPSQEPFSSEPDRLEAGELSEDDEP